MAQAREVEVKFRRDLGLLDITMIGLGPTIGTTIFLLVGPGFAITGPSLILAFGLNFVVTMFTAMAYMELGSAFPETGAGTSGSADPCATLGDSSAAGCRGSATASSPRSTSTDSASGSSSP